MSDNDEEHDPGTPLNITMRRGGTGQQGTEDTPAGTNASLNQLMILMNELQAEMSALCISHAEEIEQIRHQHCPAPFFTSLECSMMLMMLMLLRQLPTRRALISCDGEVPLCCCLLVIVELETTDTIIS